MHRPDVVVSLLLIRVESLETPVCSDKYKTAAFAEWEKRQWSQSRKAVDSGAARFSDSVNDGGTSLDAFAGSATCSLPDRRSPYPG